MAESDDVVTLLTEEEMELEESIIGTITICESDSEDHTLSDDERDFRRVQVPKGRSTPTQGSSTPAVQVPPQGTVQVSTDSSTGATTVTSLRADLVALHDKRAKLVEALDALQTEPEPKQERMRAAPRIVQPLFTKSKKKRCASRAEALRVNALSAVRKYLKVAAQDDPQAAHKLVRDMKNLKN